MKRCACLLVLLALGSCSSSATPARDSQPATEAHARDRASGAEQRAEARAPDLLALDQPAALPTSCTGSCSTQTLTATFGSVSEPFERAVYGIDQDAAGKQGLYVEALHGGFTGCPDQSSPTPARTLVISGLPLPLDSKPITKSAGLAVTLLDFKGTLLKNAPMSKATAVSVSFRAARVCPSCVGKPAPSDPQGFVALDLDATFAEGKVVGHLYAVHCDSLDK